jgi:hypothetical protein
MPRKQAAQSADATQPEIPELNLSAEELAKLHPLVRMAIELVNRDAVETATHYDADGKVVSIKQKVKKGVNRARTFHSLLNAVRPLIKLEQEWLARQPLRPPYDLDATVPRSDGTTAVAPQRPSIPPPFELLYSDIMSLMGCGKSPAAGGDTKRDVNGSSDRQSPSPGDASPDVRAPINCYRPPGRG